MSILSNKHYGPDKYYDPLQIHPFKYKSHYGEEEEEDNDDEDNDDEDNDDEENGEEDIEKEDENEILNLTSKHIFTLEIRAQSNGSWGVGVDVWDSNSPIVNAKSADHFASILGFPEFTGDLLFKYVLAYLQP